MPSQTSQANNKERRQCDGHPDFSDVQRCMPVCMNCRKAVEESLTRVAGRRLRKLRRLPSCSVETCAEFLKGVDDAEMRFHLATMAWWRFSADEKGTKADQIRAVMAACSVKKPSFGPEYMHRALKTLSPLTEEQLSVWFGCDSLYQVAALFNGEADDRIGPHCGKCRLLKTGCSAATLGRAADCTLWNDAWLQGVAGAVTKAGGWKDPCKSVKEG